MEWKVFLRRRATSLKKLIVENSITSYEGLKGYFKLHGFSSVPPEEETVDLFEEHTQTETPEAPVQPTTQPTTIHHDGHPLEVDTPHPHRKKGTYSGARRPRKTGPKKSPKKK